MLFLRKASGHPRRFAWLTIAGANNAWPTH